MKKKFKIYYFKMDLIDSVYFMVYEKTFGFWYPMMNNEGHRFGIIDNKNNSDIKLFTKRYPLYEWNCKPVWFHLEDNIQTLYTDELSNFKEQIAEFLI